MKKFILFTIVFVAVNFSILAQEKSTGTINVDIDSLLTRYHLTGIKMIVNKVGVFSLKVVREAFKRLLCSFIMILLYCDLVIFNFAILLINICIKQKNHL